jgi:phosphoribosylanthranilate isomerase
MSYVRVKICGITSKEDLKEAIHAGADAVGFIVDVPSSPRNLTLSEAAKLVKMVPIFIHSTIVTILESPDHLNNICEKTMPHGLQLHGDKKIDMEEIENRFYNIHLIKAFQVRSRDGIEKILDVSQFYDGVLLDSYLKGHFGGTGVTHDWSLSKLIREQLDPKPIILAGGLTPEVVEEAIRTVRPYAVDVSSGVESSPGVKDPQKILHFIKKAKKVKL